MPNQTATGAPGMLVCSQLVTGRKASATGAARHTYAHAHTPTHTGFYQVVRQ